MSQLKPKHFYVLISSLILICGSPQGIQAALSGAPPALLLAKELGPKFNPGEYLISEKYDGVRAYWDGKTLRFRSGRSVNAPPWFIAKLPAHAFDGELWLGRGRFEALSGIVRKAEPHDDEWRQVTYMVFELPGEPGTFAERTQRIREIVAAVGWPQLLAVEQTRVSDRASLKRKLDEVVRGGGEGLMLHLATALYLTGRSDALLKLKPLQDAQAVVVNHVPGKGKYRGMLGALRVRMPTGKLFLIGTGFTDEVRKAPPSLGTRRHLYLSGPDTNGFATIRELPANIPRLLITFQFRQDETGITAMFLRRLLSRNSPFSRS